jgi:molybdopterin-containing oxidoreductase family iron-sulfur binding subunit
VKVCPVGARFKREDGLVLTDFDRCIGCRYCEVACPYGVNYFNWSEPKGNYYFDWKDPDLDEATGGAVPPYKNPDLAGLQGDEQRRTAGGGHYKGVVEKCTFCVHRVEKGLSPACVATCPVSALLFGDLEDPGSPVSVTLRKKNHFRLLEELGTEPRVFYVGGKAPGAEAREVEPVHARV